MPEDDKKPGPKPVADSVERGERKSGDTTKFSRPAPWPSVPKPAIDNIRRPEPPKDDKKG